MIDYDTLPFKLFFKILRDESQVHLLGTDDCQKDWERIKEEYSKRHPSQEEVKLVKAHKAVIVESTYLNRDITLLKYLLTEPKNLESLYKELGFKWFNDKVKRLEYLNKQLQKRETKVQIFQARLKQLEEELSKEKDKPNEIKIESINEAIASLAMTGCPIVDFEKLTCGQYDAFSRMKQKEIDASKRKNNSK